MKYVDPVLLIRYAIKRYPAKIMGLDVGTVRIGVAFYNLGLKVQPANYRLLRMDQDQNGDPIDSPTYLALQLCHMVPDSFHFYFCCDLNDFNFT
jgi:hypothetical protein